VWGDTGLANWASARACWQMRQTVVCVIGRSGHCPREEPGHWSVPFPVELQDLQQLRREHQLAIFVTFALTDKDELALAVDIRHPQVNDLGNPQAGRIEGHQDGAVFEVRRVLEERDDFGRAQDDRQFLLVPRVRNMFNHPVSVQGVVIEKRSAHTVWLNTAHETFFR